MKKLIILLTILLKVVFAAPPTSSTPQTGYKPDCSLIGIPTINIQSFSIENKTISVEAITSFGSVQVPNATSIVVNCAPSYYVFQEITNSRNKKTTPKTSFEMICTNGALKRVNNSEFCDSKCNISNLKDYGYNISKEVLLPGESLNIGCPSGKTTKTGERFDIQCAGNGMLNVNTPKCFQKETACNFKNELLEEGSVLSCKDTENDNSLIMLSCENKKWKDETFYNKFRSTCTRNVAEIDFSFIENLNELNLIDVDDVMEIGEIIDFCKNNPTDPDCQPHFEECSLNDVKYKFGHTLKLYCQSPQDVTMIYTCVNNWVIVQNEEGEDIISEKDQYIDFESCINPVIVESIPPQEKGRALNLQSKTTLKEIKKQRYKIQKQLL